MGRGIGLPVSYLKYHSYRTSNVSGQRDFCLRFPYNQNRTLSLRLDKNAGLSTIPNLHQSLSPRLIQTFCLTSQPYLFLMD